MTKEDLINLDVQNLFQERSIDEIIEINKLLDAEINRKLLDLRLMVGDRYKDILAATEAIKCLKTISENIVVNIENVTKRCEGLVENTNCVIPSKPLIIEKKDIEERTIIVQIRIAIEINASIWVALDNENYFKAAQLHLLAQHLHTGLQLLGNGTYTKYRIINKLKSTVNRLGDIILKYATKKLEEIEISVEETSNNLAAIMLLESIRGEDLLKEYFKCRKKALYLVLETVYPNIRLQFKSLIICLYSTIQIFHDCFLDLGNGNEGLIWFKLGEIMSNKSPPILTHVVLPQSNLVSYIPEVIRNYRPTSNLSSIHKNEGLEYVSKWLEDINCKVSKGLVDVLEMVPNINGLHMIREEVLKVELPKNWKNMCKKLGFHNDFNIWYSLCQEIVTKRALALLSKNINNLIFEMQTRISEELNSANTKSEKDLRWYIWEESKDSNTQLGLSMKTNGYSPCIIALCGALDKKCFELLKDLSMYIYDKDYNPNEELKLRFNVSNDNAKRFIDYEMIEKHLKEETVDAIKNIILYLETLLNDASMPDFVIRSILCARILSGITNLCPSLKRCCSCNNIMNEWNNICEIVNKSTLKFWSNWVEDCNKEIKLLCSQKLESVNSFSLLNILCRWDAIEIQEQTDESMFKSQIRVPMKTSIILENIFDELTEMLNAVLPQSLPRQVHLSFINSNTEVILKQYVELTKQQLNQMEALQYLFDVKFLTMFCIPRENMYLGKMSQETCDKLRLFIDPFDLDVFYKYIQQNVKQNVLQMQTIWGCLLPSSGQLSSLGVLVKNKEHEKDPSTLAISTAYSNNCFLLLPVTAPVHKLANVGGDKEYKDVELIPKKNEGSTSMRSGAAALFGAMTTDWFS